MDLKNEDERERFRWEKYNLVYLSDVRQIELDESSSWDLFIV